MLPVEMYSVQWWLKSLLEWLVPGKLVDAFTAILTSPKPLQSIGCTYYEAK